MIDRITEVLTLNKLLRWPRNVIKKFLFYYFLKKKVVLLYYHKPDQQKIFNLINQIKKESEILLGHNEAHQIFKTIEAVAKIQGDIAEVGVYRGGSAKLICEAKKNKTLHLFDTFKGLPDAGNSDGLLRKGDYTASFERVKNYLKNYENVYFYKGLFPLTAEPIKNKKFSFVHLDVDLYESTLNCLKFFYPRISRGGVIISHDYGCDSGVKKAFDEFFKDKLESIIELSGTQCLVTKL